RNGPATPWAPGPAPAPAKPAPPLLARLRRACGSCSCLAPFSQDPPCTLDDGQVDHLAVHGQDAFAALLERLDHALSPRDLALARGERAVDDRHLLRVDAGLPAEAERPGEGACGLEPGIVAHVEVDDVERRPQARGGGVDDEARARVQDLEPVGARLEPELGAE